VSRRVLAFALAFGAVFGVLAGHADAWSDRHSAMILDANTGAILHDENGDELRHPASLTKMMTLYLTFETLETGRLKMSDKISISEAAAAVAPSKLELDPGDEISVSDAVRAVITKSANDIAVALAEKIGGSEANFVSLMNARARDIGMSKTHFENASGLPNDDQVTTARDMITLALHLQDDYPTYYPLFATRTFSYNGSTFRNHNTMLNSFAGVDGVKTGYTRASGFNLVTSVRRSGRHLVGAVFGGASAATRNGEMRVLLTRALTRASTEKTRKASPMLLAKLKAEPKPAERPASKRRPKVDVADAAAGAPRPFAPAKSEPANVAAADPDPDPVLREMRNAQATPAPVQVAETPVQIFKVRHVPIVPKARAATPSPDETTDMEDLDRRSDDAPAPGRGVEGRTDLGRIAANAEAGAPVKFVDQTPGSAETLVAKAASTTRRPTPPGDQIAMLGASDTVPPIAPSAPHEMATPVAFAQANNAVSAAPPPTAKPVATAKPKLAAPSPQTAPVARGLPPSTLAAQASALRSGPQPRIAKFQAGQVASLQATAGGYEVQIGAYGSISEAQRALSSVQGRTGQLLAGVASVTHPAMKDGRQVFRARFTGFNANRAASTCTELRRQAVDCFVMAGE
jgi:D-alanyl-D-alanine carboxypeptidase